jgi:transcriptional regulator with AAA-type ATPase domain
MKALSDLVGDSPGIAGIRATIGRLLQRHSEIRRLPPILIQGETGTGKGLVARTLHGAGPRSGGPFVDVNCAAIPVTLLEAEMFGFERGAFADARHAKRGLFQAAHHGTIFLDEVGLLPEALQGKLLKVIEEREVRRLGSTRSEPVDVWILTATSENLTTETRERRFREDLYHRLAVLTLWLPPLRERGSDIVLLAEHYLARACADYNLPPKRLTEEARGALVAYGWPGNVRELANVMERVALLVEAAEVTVETLGLPAAPVAVAASPSTRLPLEEAVGSVERERLLEALAQTGWNISRAAVLLGIPRNTLRYGIEKHELRPEGGTAPRPRGSGRRDPPSPAPAPAAPPAVAPATLPLASAPAAAVVRWERRRVTLLRAVLLSSGEDPGDADRSRPLALAVEKVQTFGGRLVELGLNGIIAAFGLEPWRTRPREPLTRPWRSSGRPHASGTGWPRRSRSRRRSTPAPSFSGGWAPGSRSIRTPSDRRGPCSTPSWPAPSRRPSWSASRRRGCWSVASSSPRRRRPGSRSGPTGSGGSTRPA